MAFSMKKLRAKTPILLTLLVLLMVLVFLVATLVLPPAFHSEAGAVALPDAATGERVLCIDDNLDAQIWRIRMIESAQEEIILSTFGLGTGASGKNLAATLLKAAQRGVQIRLLLDGYHGNETLSDSEEIQALVTMPNVEVRVYNEISALRLWDANYRMHDKYLIIDRELYLLGGRNSNDLFLGDYTETPNIDRDILVCSTSETGSLGQLRAYFEKVWALDACKTYTCSDTGHVEQTRKELALRYDVLTEVYPDAFGFTAWEAATIPARGVSLLAGQIQVGNKAPTLWKQLCLCMEQGRSVTIQTPYVICGKEMYEDLAKITAAGTQVTILTNSPETGANPFGCTDLRNQRDEILESGVTLMEFAGEHSLHAKTILIDGNISIVGSFNLDMRSAYIDTETMLLIDCPELNAQLRADMDGMATQSLTRSPDGTETAGHAYQKGELGPFKAIGYFFLGLVEGLFRHLL